MRFKAASKFSFYLNGIIVILMPSIRARPLPPAHPAATAPRVRDNVLLGGSPSYRAPPVRRAEEARADYDQSMAAPGCDAGIRLCDSKVNDGSDEAF